jgi:four helix bundle protein
MAAARTFTELKFWQRGREWSKQIFRLTRREPFHGDTRLVVQINDSSESVTANIAEGFGRGTQSEFVLFLGYSIGSLNETQSHLCAAYDREYLSKSEFGSLFSEGTVIRKLIVAFIRSMVMPRSGVKHIRRQKNWSEEVWELYERVTGQERPELWRKPSGGQNGASSDGCG